jgi:hypothetical protein
MKLHRLLGVTLLVAATSAFGQSTIAGRFLGNITGYGDIYVESFSQVSANVYFFDLRNGILEYATVPLLNGSGSATSALNFRVNLTISEASAAGSWGGLPFTAPRQSVIGPAGTSVFTGAIVQPASVTVAQGKLTILPNNRVILTALSQGRLIVGGTGTLSNKVITLSMTSGTPAVFGFNPDGGVVAGTALLIGSTPVQFFLVEAQRPSLVNIATRGTVGGGNQLNAGFVCVGGAKTFLVRAVGPTLAAFGVSGAQTDPKLTVYSGQTVIATNDNWGSATSAADVAAAAGQAGGFPLVNGSGDSALIIRLEPGAYTVLVDGAGSPGDALVEVYELQ